jgi:hypothetical protein
MSYTPFITPHIAANVSIPIVKKLNLETGMTYVQKGAFNKVKHEYGLTRIVYRGHLRFHYVNVPLMLTYHIYSKPKSAIWLGGGMNYGFFVAGYETSSVQVKENDEVISQNKEKNRVHGAFSGARYLNQPEGKFVNSLDIMVRFQVRYIWNDRYTVTLFHDHSIYDINAQRFSDASSILKMRYSGVSLGMKF